MLQNWLKIYRAHQVKNKVYFILTLLGLSIGLWGVLLAYLYYKEEVRYDQWNPYKDEVFLVNTDLSDRDVWTYAPYAFGSRLPDLGVKDHMYLPNYSSGYFEIDGEKRFFTKGLLVQSNFFEFFPFEIVQGDNVLDEPNSIVVLDTYAESLFGENVIGKSVRYKGEWFVVKGVYSFEGKQSSIAPTILFSGMEKNVVNNEDNWGDYNATLYLKLTDPNQVDRIGRGMKQLLYDNLYTRLAQEKGKTVEAYLEESGDFIESFRLLPLSGQHMITDARTNGTLERSVDMSRFYIVIGLAVSILFLSVVNYVNLSLVQSLKRNKEIVVQLIIGGSYFTIFKQLFLESVLTLFFASILSCVFVEFALPTIRVFLHSNMTFILVDCLAFLFLFIISIALSVSGILYFIIRRLSIFTLLKGQLALKTTSFGVRDLMMILQFVIASFFIVSTMIVYQQVHYMLDKELGFSQEEILVLPFLTNEVEGNKVRLYEVYKKELSAIPGVQQVAGVSFRIGDGGYNSTSLSYNGVSLQVANVAMDVEFLSLLKIKIVEGRGFQSELASDTLSTILVSKKFKEQVGDEDLVGKQVIWNGTPFSVVGIVDNYHAKGLTTDYLPIAYFRNETIPWLFEQEQEIYLRFDPAKIDQVLADVEKIYKKLNVSAYPFSYEFLDKRFEKNFTDSLQERNILLVLSVLAVFIALFGLYSLVSFNLTNQYKEIAIRKVLGASNKEQMKQLSRQYFFIVVIGFGLAIFPSYYFMNAWLSNYVFRIHLDWINFLLAFLVLMLLTFVTVLIKVHQALQVKVLKYIKHE